MCLRDLARARQRSSTPVRLWALCLLVLFGRCGSATELVLHVPITNDTPTQHYYFHELLTTALKEAGHTPTLVVSALPQARIRRSMDVGELSIYWMVASRERDQTYIPVETGLTNGLIGKRILFIKADTQMLYDKVDSLDVFRKLQLVGGMGSGWFDVEVWKANDLEYREHSGNWETIFKMVAIGRDYDYFSRGMNEILSEARQYPELAIEQNLVLIYDRDFRFYLSKQGPHAGVKYKAEIRQAMEQARESGLIDRLVRKYWSADFETLNYDQRLKLYLKTPQ